MRVSKTTLIGIVALVVGFIKIVFNFEVPPDVQNSFVILVLFFLGIFSKDQSDYSKK
jgi:uncharacterized membrane protein HdeD (DUF308 family)